MNFRLPKIERLDRLWEFFDGFFKDLKCDLFYQKEKKIQIFLKNENYSRKRRASSDSNSSEVTGAAAGGPSPGIPGTKLKLKKVKRDPQTSSVKSDKSDMKLEVSTSLARVSPSTSVVTRPLTPVVSPQLSPTKSGGKKVPIYHNAHKIFRAQQIARQIMGSRETEAVTSPGSPALVTVSTISHVTSVTSLARTQMAVSTAPTKVPANRSLADVSKLSRAPVTQQQPVAPPPGPPTLTPEVPAPPRLIAQAPPPLQTWPDTPPPVLQPAHKGELMSLKLNVHNEDFSFAEFNEPSEWNIEETIFNISSLDPSLGPHVENFRSHEIDGKKGERINQIGYSFVLFVGKALLLLTSEMMMKYLGLKLGPALKICNIIDKLKGKKHLPIG